MTAQSYRLTRVVSLGQEAAIDKVKALLAEEGFGVLTTIDVAATLKAKIGVDRPPYVILGACNPRFANEALTFEPGIGVLLPCNVDVYQLDGKTVVDAINPRAVFELVNEPEVAPIAEQVGAALERVLEKL